LGLFGRFRRGGSRRGGGGNDPAADLAYMRQWVAQHAGVEAFVEPKTNVTDTTVVLIAHDGEWTRRRIGSLEAAQQFGHRRSIPVYEVARVGYPKRMREYTERKKRGQA